MQRIKKEVDVLADGRGGRALGNVIALAGGAILALSALAWSTPSAAQDGGELWGRGGCGACHGTLGEGGDDPAEALGPSLRESRLERDLILETVSCGRPGTPMPFNLTGGYTEIPCYGILSAEKPAEVFGAGGFTAEELEVMVDFLMEYVVGVTRITRENCAAFFGGNANARTCAGL